MQMMIDWQMEADRANRLYAAAFRCVEKLNADLKLAKEQRNEGGEIILKLVARIETLEAALRRLDRYLDSNPEKLNRIQARQIALDQSSPSPLQAPHNPGERLRNSDVAAGEGEAVSSTEDECACGGGDISGHDAMCPYAPPSHRSSPPATIDSVPSCGQENDYRRTPPARQENDDVFKGFRGNNEA